MEPIGPIKISTTDSSQYGGGGAPRLVMWFSILLFCGGYLAAVKFDHKPDWFDVGVKASELLVWIAGLWSLVLLKSQIIDQRTTLQREFNWKRLISYHEHFDKVPGDELGAKMWRIATTYGFRDCLSGFGKPMPEEALTRILASADDEYVMRAYLDQFEKFCGAIQCGLVDNDYAYSLQATRVIRNYTIFSTFIKKIRQESSTGYLELEKVALSWEDRRGIEDATFRNNRGVRNGTGARR